MEASASQVVGSFPAVNESAPPAFEQVYQEQIASDPESFERTQQRTVANIVHVPIPQIQVQFLDGVKEIHQERLPERIEELIVNAPIEDMPVPQEQLIAEETTLSTSSMSTSSAPPSAALAPVIELNAPTPARAVLDEWIAHMTFEGETQGERMMLRRDAQEASAEQAAQELLADEMATKPTGSQPPKKQRRANTKGELWTVYELAPACPERYTNTGQGAYHEYSRRVTSPYSGWT